MEYGIPQKPSWLAALERDAAFGDPTAHLELGRLYLGGNKVPRDLTMSRRYFRHAAQLGDRTAIEVYRAFVANGTGAPPNWAVALELLDRDRSHDDTAQQLALIAAMNLDPSGLPHAEAKSETLSTDPLVKLYSGFVTAAEADYLVRIATPNFRPASVVHPGTGQMMRDPIRTSDVAAFPLALERPVIHAINRRIARASQSDVRAGEPLTVLRYQPGQYYRPHLDTLPKVTNQRFATMLLYLNEGYVGGETVFGEIGLTIKAVKGDALLFHNCMPDGTPNLKSRHEGRPVIGGEKIIASRWIRQAPLM